MTPPRYRSKIVGAAARRPAPARSATSGPARSRSANGGRAASSCPIWRRCAPGASPGCARSWPAHDFAGIVRRRPDQPPLCHRQRQHAGLVPAQPGPLRLRRDRWAGDRVRFPRLRAPVRRIWSWSTRSGRRAPGTFSTAARGSPSTPGAGPPRSPSWSGRMAAATAGSRSTRPTAPASPRSRPQGLRCTTARRSWSWRARSSRRRDQGHALRARDLRGRDGGDAGRSCGPASPSRRCGRICTPRTSSAAASGSRPGCLSSGPRTNPWFQECSSRAIEAGDLVGFDTDLIGPYGYCADISRTWLCGDGRASAAQADLYRLAREQIAYNLDADPPRPRLSRAVGEGVPAAGALPRQPLLGDRPRRGLVRRVPGDLLPRGRRSDRLRRRARGGHDDLPRELRRRAGRRRRRQARAAVLVTATGAEVLSPYPFEDAAFG